MSKPVSEALNEADLRRLHGLAYNASGPVDSRVFQPALRTLLAERDALRKALTELNEAWHELSCCDDIPLGGTLAEGISALQRDREDLRARLADALSAQPAPQPSALPGCPRCGAAVWWSDEGQNFYCSAENKGCGNDFYREHRATRERFPSPPPAPQPSGEWVLVPRVPTVDMIVSATEDWLSIRAQEDRAEAIWDAMISAAPSPLVGEG